MTQERRLAAAVGVLATIVVLGTGGYMAIEGAGLSDAVFMTLVTISTVGYEEVFPLSGAGRAFTSGLIVFGVGAGLYTAAIGLEIGLERILGGERRQRRMEREIEASSGHVVVCGFGRVGRNTWRELLDEEVPVVVIERDPERIDEAVAEGVLVVAGDATRDETLLRSGIDRARAIVACVRSDADNLAIVLSARHRRPNLRIIARASEGEAEGKLRLAGADRVVVPQQVGAQRLAALAGQPRLDEFVDIVLHGKLVELRIEEFTISPGSPLIGTTLRSSDIRSRSGALVLAVEDMAGRLLFNPDPGTSFRPGQSFIGMGTETQLDRLRHLTG